MERNPADELWAEAYKRFKKEEAGLLQDFQEAIQKNNPTGREIRLGTEQSQQQLVAFIDEKMKESEKQTRKFPTFQRVLKSLSAPTNLAMTATAASPPVNAALAGIFLTFSMAEMYSSEKTARSETAYRLAKIFIRRKAACDRVRSQSKSEPQNLKDLRESLHISYLDLYVSILKATAKLACALDNSRWEKKFLRKVQMTFGWTEWTSIHAELNTLEDDIKADENEIREYGNVGPQMPAATSPAPLGPPVPASCVRQSRNELHTAAVTNDLPKVQELLLSRRFDINARTRHQWTALMFPAEKGFMDVVKMVLLAPGLDINAQNDEGNTAIHLAATNNKLPEKQRVEMIKLLASHGAKVDVRNKGKRTAFLDASKSGNLKVVQALKQHGADINQVTGINGWSGLHEAAGQCHPEVVKWLLGKKIDVNLRTKAGNWKDNTAAQVAIKKATREKDAAKKKRFEEIQKLIEAAEATPKTTK